MWSRSSSTQVPPWGFTFPVGMVRGRFSKGVKQRLPRALAAQSVSTQKMREVQPGARAAACALEPPAPGRSCSGLRASLQFSKSKEQPSQQQLCHMASNRSCGSALWVLSPSLFLQRKLWENPLLNFAHAAVCLNLPFDIYIFVLMFVKLGKHVFLFLMHMCVCMYMNERSWLLPKPT